MLVIVDWGVGNVRSVALAFARAGAPAAVSASPDDVRRAERLVLPGVGSFDAAVAGLDARGLRPALEEARSRGAAVLGICLGLQVMTRRSAEGSRPGLGWLDAETVPLAASGRPLPHMGWSAAAPARATPLFSGVGAGPFYFAHSMAARCADPADAAARSEYGAPFVSAVARGRLFGVQFHPERSHEAGLRLLRNFAERC